MPTDNFKIDLWVKVSNLTQDTEIFTSADGPQVGAVKIGLYDGYWDASLHNVAWLADPNASNHVAIVPNAWTELTVTRVSGVTSFFVNGVQDGVTTTATPTWTTGLLDTRAALPRTSSAKPTK